MLLDAASFCATLQYPDEGSDVFKECYSGRVALTLYDYRLTRECHVAQSAPYLAKHYAFLY